MYQYLGNTGIEMNGLFNIIATYFLYIYNFANFKNKKNILGNVSLFSIKYFTEKNKFNFLTNINLWTLLEIAAISYVQYEFAGVLGLNNWFGKIVEPEQIITD